MFTFQQLCLTLQITTFFFNLKMKLKAHLSHLPPRGIAVITDAFCRAQGAGVRLGEKLTTVF